MDFCSNTRIGVPRIVIRAAARGGVDAAELLRAVGLQPCADDRGESPLPSEVEQALWAEAARRSGDPAFGLHAAERLEVGALGVVEYLARSSATLGEAYARIGRYHRLLHRAFNFQIDVRRGLACVHQALGHPPDLSAHCTEFALAAMLLLGRQVTGLDLVPVEVSFQHPRPARVAEHRRIFGVRVRFNAHRTELRLEPGLLTRPVVGADPVLCSMLEAYADELVARLPSGTSLRERVELCLTEQLRGGILSAASVAAKLRMSTRQLQRRLAAEGTTFRDLRQALRRSLAICYLQDERRSPSEVAFLLGFADPSSFHRAFKRWTGRTPAALRG